MKKLLLSLLLSASSAFAFDVPVRYIYDGDTIMIKLETLPYPLYNASVRINGIDAPEIRGKCQSEKDAAKLTKAKLQELIGDKKIITLSNFSHDKYGGRILADVNVNGKDIATEMIASGVVRKYSGGARSSWCK